MKRFLLAHVSALGLLLLAGAGARASVLTPDTVEWTYNFTAGTPGSPLPAIFADGNNSAGVNLTDEPTKSAKGSSDIVATNLRVFSSATALNPDVLVTNGAYSLTLVLNNTS